MDELDQMDAELEALAAQGGPRQLPATFSIEATHDEEASAKAGRPVYRDVEIVEIRVGRDLLRRPVTDEDRRKYAAQYLAWKKREGDETPVNGFPLSQWSAIPGKALVKELAHLGIRTVEDLATAPDATLQLIGPYQTLRQKARDWVDNAEKQAPLIKTREALDAANRRIEALERMVQQQAREIESARNGGGVLPAAPDPAIAQLQAQMAALAAKLNAAPTPPNGTPKRRGRPPKVSTPQPE